MTPGHMIQKNKALEAQVVELQSRVKCLEAENEQLASAADAEGKLTMVYQFVEAGRNQVVTEIEQINDEGEKVIASVVAETLTKVQNFIDGLDAPELSVGEPEELEA